MKRDEFKSEARNPWPRPIPDIVHGQPFRPTAIWALDYAKGGRARAGLNSKQYLMTKIKMTKTLESPGIEIVVLF
jgi:hypothetical protein